jgi:arginyl-tRNA synthetase
MRIIEKTEEDGGQEQFLGIDIPPLPHPDIPIVPPDIERFPYASDYPLARIKAEVLAKATQALGVKNDATVLTVGYTPDHIQSADITLACQKAVKGINKPLQEVTKTIADHLSHLGDALSVEPTSNGYVNIELDPAKIAHAVLHGIETMGDHYGEQNIGNGETAVIDLSSPNIAKHMSIGHLRSTVIGESLARIYNKAGYRVIRDNHIGDWGTQFGMLGRAYELWGNEIAELKNPETQVEGLYQLYVRMHEEIEKQKATNPEKPSALEQEGRDWFKKLETGDRDAKNMYEWALQLSFEEFDRVYDKLGSQFEYTLGESQYEKMLPSIASAIEAKGIAQELDGGALVVVFEKTSGDKPLAIIPPSTKPEDFPDKRQLETLVIRKSDGTSLYATRELATLAARTAWFNPAEIVYVVGGEQKEYFRQVFKAFRTWAEDKTPKLVHVPFGMITLPEGRMSTRKGKVIFLEDVLKESILRAKAKINQEERNLTEEEVDTIARQVGVGAVKFMDLGQGRERNIKFDWDTALSFDQNSSPRIQYAHARAKSILRKAEESGITLDTQKEPVMSELPEEIKAEKQLVMQMGKFPEVIASSLETHEPSHIAQYLSALTDTYNTFYRKVPVLKESDPDKMNTSLRLTAASAQVLKNGLHLLGIEAPDKM